MLFHFTEDPSIERFVPHVPTTNPDHIPAVWAIDAAHAPLYWFPRDCPRVTAWPNTAADRPAFEAAWTTTARRVHAAEAGWLERIRATELYRYDLPATDFRPWPDATGQWVAHEPVVPRRCVPVGDLLARHADAGVELRLVPDLWPLHDLAARGPWDFSIVRMRNAQPRR